VSGWGALLLLLFLAVALFSRPAIAEEIQLTKHGGTYSVPVRINDALTLDFVLDTGAADVSIPADVVMTLLRTGTVASSDFTGKATYVLADGSKLPSLRFLIRKLGVGRHAINNVGASVAPVAGTPLLGQSFLSRLPPWAIDYSRGALVLHALATAAQPNTPAIGSANLSPPTPTASSVANPFGRSGRWSSTAYPGAGGEIQLTDIAMIADGSMVGRILFSGSRCASWANFSGRVSGDSASLSMYVGQCGLTVATLKHVANGWVGSYRSQYPDSGVVQLAQQNGSLPADRGGAQGAEAEAAAQGRMRDRFLTKAGL